MLALLLLACSESKIPPGSQHFSVTVEAESGGYTETFEYYVSFDATSATLFIGESAFARGTLLGCEFTYQSVVFGQTRPEGDVKWQLYGQASVESAEGDPCVDGEDDWSGTEYAEIVASDDEAIEIGTEYNMLTTGKYLGDTE
ncbi:MAG: hypothetical protein FJ090_17845 [Deltaproteobacteria bacterium]|nr:hypothetical protein [Deltaproteobacteria bacterium]MBM4392993.1 hypothetical protein [Deltaproteobacteria bacterium]